MEVEAIMSIRFKLVAALLTLLALFAAAGPASAKPKHPRRHKTTHSNVHRAHKPRKQKHTS